MNKRNRAKNAKRAIVIGAIAIVGSIALCLVYVYYIYPVLAIAFHPAKEYSGAELYAQEEISQFDDGLDFLHIVDGLDMIDDGKIQNFYYYDNCDRDTVPYGKMCDFYILEISSEEQFENAQIWMENQNLEAISRDGYLFYRMPCDIEEKTTDAFYVALHQDKTTIRCLYIVDLDNPDNDYHNLNALSKRCSLGWD